jgi:hypothetical protein
MATGVNGALINIAMTSTSPFKGTPYYDPIYDALRAFLRGEITWEEVQKVDLESRQTHDQHERFLQRLTDGLRNPETRSQVVDLVLSVPLTTTSTTPESQ